MSKPWIYVSGPISIGVMTHNARNAVDVSETILLAGGHPIVPHLSMFWDFAYPKSWKDWIDYDLETIKRCDAIYRIPGESRGSDLETNFAIGIGIPVFYDIFVLIKTFPSLPCRFKTL